MKRDNLSIIIDDLTIFITSLDTIYGKSSTGYYHPNNFQRASKKDTLLKRATSARRRLLKRFPLLEDSFIPPAGQSRSQFFNQIQHDIDGAWNRKNLLLSISCPRQISK